MQAALARGAINLCNDSGTGDGGFAQSVACIQDYDQVASEIASSPPQADSANSRSKSDSAVSIDDAQNCNSSASRVSNR